MRILLLFIVILNLLYVGWEYLSPGADKDVIAPLPDNLKTLNLLHEPEVKELQMTDVISESVAISEVENPVFNSGDSVEGKARSVNSVSCYTLGPFKDESIMQQLRESIAEYVMDISVRKRQESEKHRYWVYVPALPNRKQAKLMAKKLRQKKVNDFYIVLSGDAKNSISLGHFREPKHASRRLNRVVGLGFNAEINVIYRDYDIYWLDYQVDTVNGESGFSVDEYISGGVSQLVRDCKI